MMSKFKVGDRVVDIVSGEGEVVEISHNVIAQLNSDRTCCYLRDGRVVSKDIRPSLYLASEFYNLFPQFRPELKVNDRVYVRDRKIWMPSHFSGWSKDGKIMIWDNGRTSFTTATTSTWDEWKLP